MEACFIPVSIGELYDKYTILRIKSEKLTDCEKLTFVNKEISYLTPYIDKYTSQLDMNLVEELKNINTILWDIEEDIREKERKQEFDDQFIALARMVYKTNDKRSVIKADINKLLHSNIREVKSYA